MMAGVEPRALPVATGLEPMAPMATPRSISAQKKLLTLDGLRVSRGAREVIAGVDLRVEPGELVALLGANGAGKTSLMRAALGLIAHDGASSLAAMSATARARACAWLPQDRQIAWGMPVAEVVRLGRLPQGDGTAASGQAAVAAALARMGLADFAARPATALSGGEQARVLMARALAQQAPLILADEPTAGLDPAAQIAAMEVLAGHARAGGAALVSLHDLGLAARHATRIVVLHAGRVLADGAPGTVLTDAVLAEAFGIRAFHADGPDGIIFQPTGVI